MGVRPEASLRYEGRGHVSRLLGGARKGRTGEGLVSGYAAAALRVPVKPHSVTAPARRAPVCKPSGLVEMDRPTGLLFLVAVCGLSFTRAQNTTEPTAQPPAKLSNSELLAAIIVPSVVGGLIIIGILYFVIAKIRERRRTEGTYRPSNEEQAGSRVEPNAGLKLPPEERLI